MLQTNMRQNDGATSSIALDGQRDPGIGALVKGGIAFLRRQYLVVLLAAALATAAAVTHLLMTPRTYSTQAQIILANPPQFVQQQSLADTALDFSRIETHLQIIKSRPIAIAVINELKLEDDPDFKGPGPSFLSALRYRIRAWLLPRRDGQVAAPDQPPAEMIKGFNDRLTASRVGYSSIIEIGFTSSSAQRAAEIANAVAKAYIADQLNAKVEANRVATGWLQERLHDLDRQALAAERAVSAYKSQNNIVVTSGGLSIHEQKVGDLNNRLTVARAQGADALARLSHYETILRTNSLDSSSIRTLDVTGPDASAVNILREKYLELGRSESDLSSRFGADHRAVVDLRSRMGDLRGSILDEVRRLAGASRAELNVAKLRQEEIEKQLAEAISQVRSTNAAEMTIRGMENQAKTLRAMYDTFLRRYTGSVQQETFPNTETRVLTPASPPQQEDKPKGKKIVLVGLAGGLAVGIGLGFLRESIGRVFRTSKQIGDALDLPCLALVPLLNDPKPADETPAPQQAEENLTRPSISTEAAIHNLVARRPLSRFAEAIRSIKLAIDLDPNAASSRIIGITSTLPGEGKTTIAASLAEAFVQSGKKIIVVDCDLRNPSLSAKLAPGATTGIVEVIHGKASIEETIWQDSKTNLAFLPAVRQEPATQASETLYAGAMRKLFEELRTDYDYIIVDLPPIAPLVDIRAASMVIECFIFVVEWGQTKIDVVQHALRTVPNTYKCMIGAVLNKADFKAMARYDPNWNDFDKYYALYGFSDGAEPAPNRKRRT